MYCPLLPKTLMHGYETRVIWCDMYIMVYHCIIAYQHTSRFTMIHQLSLYTIIFWTWESQENMGKHHKNIKKQYKTLWNNMKHWYCWKCPVADNVSDAKRKWNCASSWHLRGQNLGGREKIEERCTLAASALSIPQTECPAWVCSQSDSIWLSVA